jgi:hypothetical protein
MDFNASRLFIVFPPWNFAAPLFERWLLGGAKSFIE